MRNWIALIFVGMFSLSAIAQAPADNLDDFVIEDPNQPSPQEIQGTTPPVPAPAEIEGLEAVTNVSPVAPVSPLSEFLEDINYSSEDKRDPFLPFLTLTKVKVVNTAPETALEPLQQFALDQLKVIGIIWDVGKPKALVADPGGKSYIVIENTKMGKDFGYVAAIREGEVIVVEQYQDGQGNKSFQTKILKLSQK